MLSFLKVYTRIVIFVHERCVISAKANEVWSFLAGMDRENYLRWHPADHLDFRLLREARRSDRIGRVVYFRERIGRRPIGLRCIISASQPGRFVEYRPIYPFLRPLSSLGRGYFRLRQLDEGSTRLEAVIEIGWHGTGSAVFDWLIGQVVDLTALRKHMREEGSCLDRTLAGRGQAYGRH